MTQDSYDADTAAETVASNSTLTDSLFEVFKKTKGLPPDTSITDALCQRKLKINNGSERTYFKPYYGLTVAIFLPHELSLIISECVYHFRQKLSESGLESAFLFLPSETYHVTVMGIIERIAPEIETNEVLYYSSQINKADKQLTNDQSPTRITIKSMRLSDQLVIYFEVAFDKIPVQSLAALTSQVGKRKLHTGKFHLTICYLTRDLSIAEQRVIVELLEQTSSLLREHATDFSAQHAALYAFDSMVSYRRIKGTDIRLA